MQAAQTQVITPNEQSRHHGSSSSTSQPSTTTFDVKDNNHRAKIRTPVIIDSTLLPHAQSSRHFFSQALLADQKSALQPDYKSPFRSANDVVQRLLPYHVWHVNKNDLEWVLQKDKRRRKHQEDDDVDFPSREETYDWFSRYSKLSKRAKSLQNNLQGASESSNAATFGKEATYHLEKLSTEYERQLLINEQEKLRRIKEEAIAAGVSWEALMRMSLSFGQNTTQGVGSTSGYDHINTVGSSSNVASLNKIYQKGQATNLYPSTGMTGPLPNYLDSNDIHSPSPTTPRSGYVKGARPRGRPRKNLAASTYSPRIDSPNYNKVNTPPTARPNYTPQSVHTPTSSHSTKPSTSTPKMTTTTAIASPSSTTNTNNRLAAIPSHPIPLVLPLSTLSQLSSLGIAPIPAPHLLPAITAQQQAQAQRSNPNQIKTNVASSQINTNPSNLPIPAIIHSTAPRPAPLNQQEPALLMGITEAPLYPRRETSEPRSSSTVTSPNNNTTTTSNTTATQQMLHVSVVLSKLSPSQLSGLATLMQSLQQSTNNNNSNTSKASNSNSDGK